MPLYEYKCHRCGKTFEVIQKFSDEPLTRHEDCGGELEQVISAPALQFKGTGWYITDYARGKGSNGSAGKSDSKSSGSSGGSESGSSSSGSESKPETKSESKPASKE